MQRKILDTAAAAILGSSLALAQAPPAAPPIAGGAAPYQRASQLPARIMDFKTEPASIQPGQSVTVTWATENPTLVSIDPDVGRVTPRGARQLSPARTTTYTLTVRGPNNQVLTKAVTVNVTGTTPAAEPAAATDVSKQQVPRASNGKPDLSGVYDFSGGGRGGASAIIGPAGPSLKPGAEKFKVVRGPDDTGQYADCMPLAGPQAFSVPYQFQLVESAHHVAILYGYPGSFRIIPTDGGVHPADPDPTWMGDSIGHWDGDTLVVDTVGFNNKTEISGFRHTEALHMVERFSRPTYNALEYEVSLEDPNVFLKPWTFNRTFLLRPELSKVDEFVCENNPNYSGLFEKKK